VSKETSTPTANRFYGLQFYSLSVLQSIGKPKISRSKRGCGHFRLTLKSWLKNSLKHLKRPSNEIYGLNAKLSVSKKGLIGLDCKPFCSFAVKTEKLLAVLQSILFFLQKVHYL
jgi:hypothetical protein